MNIKDIVKNATASFQYASDGNLWYKTSTGYEFPVPFTDTKGGVFKAEDKAIFFMRWIRKHVENSKV